jgi:hypothetical protein
MKTIPAWRLARKAFNTRLGWQARPDPRRPPAFGDTRLWAAPILEDVEADHNGLVDSA